MTAPAPRDVPDEIGPDVVARLEHKAAQERAARLEAERTAETQLRRAFERAREVELLASIAVIVNDADDALSAMSAAAKVIRRHCRFAVSHVLLRGEDGDYTTSDLWDADPEQLDFLDAVMADTVDRSFGPGRAGLPSEVIASHLAAWIPDVSVSAGYARGEVAERGGTWAFPVVVGIEVAAVVEFLHPEPLAADERLLQLAPSLGAQLGRAFEWEQVQQRQAADRRRLEELLAQRTQDVAALSRPGRTTDDARSAFASYGVHEAVRAAERLRGHVDAEGERERAGLAALAESLVGLVDGTERRVAGPRTPVLPARLMAEVAARCSTPTCEVAVVDTRPAGHPVEIGASLAEHALEELVTNAVRHSGAPRVELSFTTEDGAVVLQVSDTGVGHSWTPPARLVGGAGLTQVARIALTLGGSVTVERQPGGGTVARLRVNAPVHVTAVEAEASTRVLLVDDNDVNRRLAAAMLGKLGVPTDVVDSGEAALEAMRATSYGLVLMDVQMPGIDGRQATQAWRTGGRGATPPDVPIVALTAHVGQIERDLCRDAGMVDYLSKPFGLDALSEMVTRWLSPAGGAG